jgi:hypothetical protein
MIIIINLTENNIQTFAKNKQFIVWLPHFKMFKIKTLYKVNLINFKKQKKNRNKILTPNNPIKNQLII